MNEHQSSVEPHVEQTSAAGVGDLDWRRTLYERFGPAQVAMSTDGREIHAMAPIELGLVVGSFAIVETDLDGPGLVVQIRAAHLDERPGPELQVATDLDVPGAHVVAATVRPLLRVVTCSGAVLGTLGDDGFRRTDAVAPFGERRIRCADHDEIAAIAKGLTPAPAIAVGFQAGTEDVAAVVAAKGFSRHTFMCGQSGSGKTYTTGGIFERLLAETSLPLVVLDPNSDHIHLGRLAETADTTTEAARFAAAAAAVRVVRARGHESDHVLCADVSDLPLEAQALLLRLHPVHDAVEFDAFRRLAAALPVPYSMHDLVAAADEQASDDASIAAIAMRIRNLGIADWDVWRRPGEVSIAGLDLRAERCLVFDLGSLPSSDERTAVSLAVLGNRWRLRADRRPVLIAIDEAHNVFPAATDDALLQATSELGVLIAGEGRKFGLHLFVASQRPAKVHPNVVSQCDNLMLMRMNGAGDVEDLVTSFSHVPAAMIRSVTGFGLGQALLAGPISPVPVFVQIGRRLSPEGGADVPTTWAEPPRRSDS
jgi:uncharacterized protein